MKKDNKNQIKNFSRVGYESWKTWRLPTDAHYSKARLLISDHETSYLMKTAMI